MMWTPAIIICISLAVITAVIILVYVIVIAIGAFHRLKNVKCKSGRRLDGRTAIVTGGTAGMGLEIATELARRGANVVIACPFENEGIPAQNEIIAKTGNQKVVFKLLNLASLASVRKFAEDILQTRERLDILINNAGVLTPDSITEDGLNFIMQVNYFGHFLLTLLLLPLLKSTGEESDPSRIVNVSSMSHTNGTIDFENINKTDNRIKFKIYFNSKLCVTMFSKELTKRLKGSNVVVNTADPGVVATGIFDGYSRSAGCLKFFCGSSFPTPWEGAQTSLHLALDEKAGEMSGQYFYNCKLSKAGRNTEDEILSQRLWEESVRIVKLNDNSKFPIINKEMKINF